MIRVLIADNHPLLRKMLKETLERESDMKVTGEAEDTHHVMEGARKKVCDIVITSLSLPGTGSLNMIKDLKRLSPGLHVLVLTMHPESLFGVQTLKSGASGYLTKDMPPEEIIKAVRDIVSGKKYIPESLAERLAVENYVDTRPMPHDSLTDSEFQVMCALASGKTITAIAREFGVNTQAASSLKSIIMKKISVKTIKELKFYVASNHIEF